VLSAARINFPTSGASLEDIHFLMTILMRST
jgi:hypothetical protein